jgi:predicted DNA-binding transcriptional regulator AlpA
MAPKLPEFKLKPLSHFRALAEEMDGSGILAPVPRPDNSGDRLQNQRDDTMLHIDDVVRMCGVSESWVYRAVLEGRFPKPTWLPTGRRGWPAHKVKEWQASLDVDTTMRDSRRLPNVKR